MIDGEIKLTSQAGARRIYTSRFLFWRRCYGNDLRIKFPDIEKTEELKDYWEAGVFPSIEIQYLAVKKEYRGQYIGKDIISIINSFKYDSYYHHPLFMSVQAYRTTEYSAVGFYEKCRFWASEFVNPNVETVRMYRTLY